MTTVEAWIARSWERFKRRWWVLIAASAFGNSLPEARTLCHAQNPAPMLAIWPENSLSESFPWNVSSPLSDRLASTSRELGVPLLVGCTRFLEGDRLAIHNSIVLVSPHSTPSAAWNKRHLTPLTEGRKGWLLRLATSVGWLAPISTVSPPLEPGEAIPVVRHGDWSFAVAICHDLCFAEWGCLATQQAESPDFLIHCGSESADRTGRMQRLLLACAQLRAVESRRGIVRCVRDGYSAVIDGNGRILQCLSDNAGHQPFVSVPIPIDSRRSWYHVWGNAGVMVWLTLVATIGEVVVRRSRRLDGDFLSLRREASAKGPHPQSTSIPE